jgi:hypothetical protein
MISMPLPQGVKVGAAGRGLERCAIVGQLVNELHKKDIELLEAAR